MNTNIIKTNNKDKKIKELADKEKEFDFQHAASLFLSLSSIVDSAKNQKYLRLRTGFTTNKLTIKLVGGWATKAATAAYTRPADVVRMT